MSTKTEEASILPDAKAFKESFSALDNTFAQWRERGSLPQNLLLTHALQVEMLTQFALVLSQTFLCENAGFQTHGSNTASNVGFACQKCASCLKVASQNHPDFEWVAPESATEDGAAQLKIDRFRDLKSKQGFSAHQSKFKIVLVTEAEKFTTAAANSLLKLLEEPPASWIFILTAKDAESLLPTIRSRMVKLPIFLKPAAQKETDSKVASAFHDFLKRPTSAALFHTLEFAVQKREAGDELVQLLENTVRDGLALTTHAIDSAPATAPFHTALKNTLPSHLLSVFYLNRMEQLAEFRQIEMSNVNRKLALQTLLVPWMTPFHAQRVNA